MDLGDKLLRHTEQLTGAIQDVRQHTDRFDLAQTAKLISDIGDVLEEFWGVLRLFDNHVTGLRRAQPPGTLAQLDHALVDLGVSGEAVNVARHLLARTAGAMHQAQGTPPAGVTQPDPQPAAPPAE